MERVYYTCKEVKAGSCERKSSDHALVLEKLPQIKKQQSSKMDVSGKKEQRKGTELDESWLKFTHEK